MEIWQTVIVSAASVLAVLLGSGFTAWMQWKARSHEMEVAAIERSEQAERHEKDKEDEARKQRREELINAHESAIVALRRLLSHEASASLFWQEARIDRSIIEDRRTYDYDNELEVAAGVAVARVRLLEKAKVAERAENALARVRELRHGQPWEFRVPDVLPGVEEAMSNYAEVAAASINGLE